MSVVTDILDIKESVGRIEEVLNGPKGLVTTVVLHDTMLVRLEETLKEWKRVMVGIGTTIILAIGTFLWALLTHNITLTKGP